MDDDDWTAPTLDLDEPRALERARRHPPTHVDAYPAEQGTPLHVALIGAIRRAYARGCWTVERLADAVGSNTKTVQRVLHGQRCEMSTVERLMRALGIEARVVDSIYQESRAQQEWWEERPIPTPEYHQIDEGLERLRSAGVRR